MPELPDVVLYVRALERRLVDTRLVAIRLRSPFLLRSVETPLEDATGRRLVGVDRIGKRVVMELEDEVFLVIHLMIAGRLRWKKRAPDSSDRPGIPGRVGLAAFDFEGGTLTLTEAGTKKRASLHCVRGRAALGELDPGGLEPLECDLETFHARLTDGNHTVKRALCEPKRFSGIGNAYSDEILHHARLSPLKWTSRLSDEEIERLYHSVRHVLTTWVQRLADELGDGFPTKVTAFRPGMAVHGKYRQPCPVCAGAVQRIVYASNETNYCPGCQTGGKVLRDRALSQLMKDGWPPDLDVR